MINQATIRYLRRLRPQKYNSYQVCSCCHLYVDARNRKRHVKACMRWKREQPADWAAWQKQEREYRPQTGATL